MNVPKELNVGWHHLFRKKFNIGVTNLYEHLFDTYARVRLLISPKKINPKQHANVADNQII